jgi:chitinase
LSSMSTPDAIEVLPEEPEGPRRRLSPIRLVLVLVAVIVVIASSSVGVRSLIDNSGPSSQTWFAPYIDMTLPPTLAFEDPAANPAREVVLGFVVADQSSPCTPSWGGAYSLDRASSDLELDRRVAQFRRAGGDVMISFGGQRNTELAVACNDANALAGAYEAVVNRYGLDIVDFDIEGAAIDDSAANQRRAQAIAAAQQNAKASGRSLVVWLTIPVARDGMTAGAQLVVKDVLAAGVDLAGVNLMTMDFGPTGQPEGNAVVSALNAGHDQLISVYTSERLGLTSKLAWGKLGATVMIGQNDLTGEQFTQLDANTLISFAVDNGLARVSMWSENRDLQCGSSFARVGVLSNSCSGVAENPLEFTKTFGARLTGSALNVTGTIRLPDPTPPAADDPAKSPYPIWSPKQMYRTGYKVVWHGNVYEAKWFSQGSAPDAPAQNPWETPWQLVGPVLSTDRPPAIPTLAAGTFPDWSPKATYVKGTRVLYQGLPYIAKYLTVDDLPDASLSDPESPWTPLYTIPGEPST